ncbi:MAG TPA: glutamyl-tRNA reductase [Acidobacteriaceae bacterium]|nr:glutamyl-tRNA reductase [Terriglobia bacterium]HVC90157.1 glutamyl-tRNA reductase [Acidobacteriaceae bacterium]
MNLVLIGVNHKSAPLEVRERLAIPAARLEEATLSLLSVPCVREGMILSTCNRVEFLTYQEPAQADLLEFIRNYFAVDTDALRPYIYEYRASEVVRHLFRVASSLDSLVIGEPQILGQVKGSYTVARSIGGVNNNLDPLMQRAFTVARKVRNQTSIGVSSVSIASVAVDLARKIFGSLQGKTILLMGAGKMGELAARSLMHQGAGKIYLCNRTDERAAELAEKFSSCPHAAGQSSATASPVAQAIPYASLHQVAATADIIVSSTGSEQPIFLRRDAELYMHRRKQRPMFFIDIAVPRDVDPEINGVEGVFVYNIDDLQAVAISNLSNRAKEALDAEAIVRAEVERYTRRMHSLDGVPSIVALQESLEEVRQNELRRMTSRLSHLTSEELHAVEQMTRSLVHKLQHAPIQAIKRAAQEGDRETLATIQSVFDLEHRAKDAEDAPITEKAKTSAPLPARAASESIESAFVPTPDATRPASSGTDSAPKSISEKEDCLP